MYYCIFNDKTQIKENLDHKTFVPIKLAIVSLYLEIVRIIDLGMEEILIAILILSIHSLIH